MVHLLPLGGMNPLNNGKRGCGAGLSIVFITFGIALGCRSRELYYESYRSRMLKPSGKSSVKSLVLFSLS